MNKLENRALEVTIQKIGSDNNIEFSKIFNNLNVKFSYRTYRGSPMGGKGSVSICGLNRDTLDTLISFSASAKTIKERKLIQVKAGYGDRLALIINGSIISAIPTAPPDIWLKCDVINGYELRKKHITTTIEEGLTLSNYAQAVADVVGIPLEMRITDSDYLNKKMSGKSFEGNIFQLAYTIKEAFKYDKNTDNFGGIVAYIENETLIVDYRDIPSDERRTENPLLISKDTGMVGLPEFSNDAQLASITTLLKPEIKTGDVIEVKSEQIKGANGLFFVQGITYTGEFRGTSWYSTFSCWRIR